MEQILKYTDHTGTPQVATFTGDIGETTIYEFIDKLTNKKGIDSYMEIFENGKKTLGISPTQNRKKLLS